MTLWRTLSEWPLRSTNPGEVAAVVERLEGEVHPAALATTGSKTPRFHAPAAAASVPATQAAHTFVAIAQLLGLEKRGYSAALISARGRLRDLEPEMFAIYMARRDVDHR